MSDVVLGYTNYADDGTELVPDSNAPWRGNDYLFKAGPGAIIGVRGHGQIGVHGETTCGIGVRGVGTESCRDKRGRKAGGFGVVGEGGHVGVEGLLTGASVPDNFNINDVGVLGSAAGREDTAIGVMGLSDQGEGVLGSSQTFAGVHGLSTSGEGVVGESFEGTGVHGKGGNIGVQGDGEEFGVIGNGVISGVLGKGDAGVSGEGSNFGVFGESINGYGIYGGSNSGYGIFGHAANGIGVVGATRDPVNQYAGVFYGKVIVWSDFFVLGAKHAAVPHPEGSHRLMYSMESPESWFEDFGEGKLVNGKAEVKLDPDFAALVKTKHYHVFVTPYGDSHGLYVAKRTDTGFEVREQQGGKSSLEFSYRVVAKRKDIAGERLKKVTLPPAPPEPTKMPKLPHHKPAQLKTGKK